jgi:hypothetical protein
MAECKERRLSGELTSHVASALCSNDRARQVIAASGYPHMDLADLLFAYRMALARRTDEGQLSEQEANLQLAELRTRLASEEQRRNIMTQQVELQAQQAYSHWLQGYGTLLQGLGTWNQSLTPTAHTGPVTCFRSGNAVTYY